MSIMELGALGEFVGSFFVLITLVYLSIQVRQNNKMTRTNMRMAVSAAQVDAMKIYVDPKVAEIVAPLSVAESGFPEPGTPESSVVYGYVNINIVALQNGYHQAIEGVLDDVDTALRRMRTWATIPLHRHMWREWQLGNWCTKDFSQAMDAVVDEGEAEARNFAESVREGKDVFTSRTETP